MGWREGGVQPPRGLPAAHGQSPQLGYDQIVSQLRSAGCVFAEDEARLLLAEGAGPAELSRNIQQRVEGVPLEHILGWAEFAGGRVVVEPGVFVPRRRTELLVNAALDLLAEDALALPADAALPAPPVVVDLCCGSGAVGTAILRHAPQVELHAADIEPAAVRCARRNLEPLGGHVHAGDLFAALPAALPGRVRVLAVNAPYVPTRAIRTMPPEARLYEPAASLDGGPDGLDFHRRVAAEGVHWLAPHGHLLIETSEQQAAGTSGILAAAGFAVRTVRSEELDGTVVVGRLPAQGVGAA
ncbi:N5-glutamine S-adenosyl-L-methionine-dependent methyltransferase [Arthrobacter sp. NicSoilC5]|nr:N5-glutamine S-adenosyl-L-methionine-dependent methyltransferase [Arthrobacter sp. NicSoilC5]